MTDLTPYLLVIMFLFLCLIAALIFTVNVKLCLWCGRYQNTNEDRPRIYDKKPLLSTCKETGQCDDCNREWLRKQGREKRRILD